MLHSTPTTKHHRQRIIPLNHAARASMEWILERWAKIGGSSPEHYILSRRRRGVRAPHWRKGTPWILNEAATAMYSAVRSIRMPHPGDHQAAIKSERLPAGVPEIARHISQAMRNRYTLQTHSIKEAALDNAPSPALSEPDPRKLSKERASLHFPGQRLDPARLT